MNIPACLRLALAVWLCAAAPLIAMQSERKVYRIGGDVTAPRVLHKEDPHYTAEAREAATEGTVLLAVVIEVDGSITQARIERSLDPGLDKKAVEAVRRWRFRPAERAGAAVAVQAMIEMHFRLR